MQMMITSLMLLFATQPYSQRAQLEGCLPVPRLTTELSKVRDIWPTLTAEQIAKTWPTQLLAESCETEKGECLILVGRSRVIGGEPECTETFIFDAADKGSQLALDSVIVNYTTLSYTDAVATADGLSRVFRPARVSRSAGSFPGSESAPLDVRFDWEQGTWLWVEEVSVHPQNSRWRVHLSIGRTRK